MTRQRFWSRAALALAATLAVVSLHGTSSAQQVQTQRAQVEVSDSATAHANPLRGTVVLWGGGEPSDDVTNAFKRMAKPPAAGRGNRGAGRRGGQRGNRGRGNQGGDGSQGGNNDSAGQDAQQPPQPEAKIANWKPGEPLPQNIDELDGVWVTATPDEYQQQVAGTLIEQQLRKVVERGGAVAIPAMSTSLFPFVNVSSAFLNSDHSSAEVQAAVGELKSAPGTFGVGLAEGTALFLNRRRVVALGDEAAMVVLPPSASREALFTRLSGMREAEDLVGLSRGSVARLGAAFPPAEMRQPFVEHGSLLIVGGGGMTEEMWQTFIDSAGGPDAPLVILPTASNPPNPNSGEARVLQRMGATDVTVLTQNTPEGVASPEFVNALKRAKGVWFGGGRQWNFVDAYDGTEAVELFHDVLRRGGIIAGSSAGASIQAEYMVRGSPLVNTIMMAEGYERGFGFLPGSAVDQHFTQRNRFDDLKGVHETFPQLMCFGIDETTGIYLRKNVLQVMGRGGVAIFDTKTTPDAGKDYFSLATGEYFDLQARKKITADEAAAMLESVNASEDKQ